MPTVARLTRCRPDATAPIRRARRCSGHPRPRGRRARPGAVDSASRSRPRSPSRPRWPCSASPRRFGGCALRLDRLRHPADAVFDRLRLRVRHPRRRRDVGRRARVHARQHQQQRPPARPPDRRRRGALPAALRMLHGRAAEVRRRSSRRPTGARGPTRPRPASPTADGPLANVARQDGVLYGHTTQRPPARATSATSSARPTRARRGRASGRSARPA